MRLVYRDYLVTLVGDAEAAATRIADAEPAARQRLAASARRESARLSARLDASPLTDATAAEVDEREEAGSVPAPVAIPQAAGTGGWARTLKVDELASQEIAAVEYANLLACFDAEPDIAAGFFDKPRAALEQLHGLVCRGLVVDDMLGQPRRSQQSVHDGAQGQVIYHAAPPERIADLLDELTAWLTGPGAAVHPLIVAGVVHERLLQWQPFEAGNGRLARAASRVVLRAGGLDTDGVAVAERLPAADPAGYYGEVAATIRRRDDLGPWLQRAAEGVVAGMRVAADALAPARRPPLPTRATATAEQLAGGQAITVAEYAQRAEASRAAARRELRALAAAGELAVEPGTHGLRYRRP